MSNPWDNAACMELDRFLDARGIRHSAPTLGSTLGSPPGGHGHTAGSNHYPEQWGGPRGSTGQARDYGDLSSDCEAIARAFEPYAQGPNYIISELIWTRSKRLLSRNGIYYKRGVAYVPSFSLARQHNDHDHVAIAVGRHLPNVAPGPAPQPPKPPVPVLEEDDMSLFVRGDKTPTVYELSPSGLFNVKSQAALADLAYLGHGKSPVPSGAKTETNNGVKVVVVAQRLIDELL